MTHDRLFGLGQTGGVGEAPHQHLEDHIVLGDKGRELVLVVARDELLEGLLEVVEAVPLDLERGGGTRSEPLGGVLVSDFFPDPDRLHIRHLVVGHAINVQQTDDRHKGGADANVLGARVGVADHVEEEVVWEQLTEERCVLQVAPEDEKTIEEEALLQIEAYGL